MTNQSVVTRILPKHLSVRPGRPLHRNPVHVIECGDPVGVARDIATVRRVLLANELLLLPRVTNLHGCNELLAKFSLLDCL